MHNYNTEGNLIKPQPCFCVFLLKTDYNTEGNLIKPQHYV